MTVEIQDNLQAPAGGLSVDDLNQMIEASNLLTSRLQESHQRLQVEVVRLRRQLASADAQLQRSRRLAALGEMATGIAHEIRNPLGAIQLYNDMIVQDLAAGAPTQTTTHYARTIATAVRGLDAIVRDVLSFARELSPQLQQRSALQLFNDVIDAQRIALEHDGVEVVIDAGASLPAAAVDAGMIRQALINLVQNAAQAMSDNPSDAPRRLTLAAMQDDEQLVLRVSDTGPGIAAEDFDRIFNPFYTTRNTGTGLGLAIVHRIIDAHGGSICAANHSGAMFEIRLPIDTSREPETDKARHEHQ